MEQIYSSKEFKYCITFLNYSLLVSSFAHLYLKAKHGSRFSDAFQYQIYLWRLLVVIFV